MTELTMTTSATDEATEFHVTDEASANWLLRKLANIEAEKQRVQAQAADIVRQLEADAASLHYRYGAELEEFARRTLEITGSRRRSLTLLQGTLAFRAVPASLRIADRDAALAWAKSNRRDLVIVETRESLDLPTFRQTAAKIRDEDGELLPGVELTPEHQSFTIKFGKSE